MSISHFLRLVGNWWVRIGKFKLKTSSDHSRASEELRRLQWNRNVLEAQQVLRTLLIRHQWPLAVTQISKFISVFKCPSKRFGLDKLAKLGIKTFDSKGLTASANFFRFFWSFHRFLFLVGPDYYTLKINGLKSLMRFSKTIRVVQKASRTAALLKVSSNIRVQWLSSSAKNCSKPDAFI